MSPSELAEAGVLGLEDYLVLAERDDLCDSRPTAAASEMEASDDDERCTDAAKGAETAACHSRSDLLTELRKVCILDELIVEENLKIHKLRCCKEIPNEELSVNEASDTNRLSRMSKEREAFRLQLEEEKKEVDKLEKSLGRESEVKKPMDRAKKVVKCSVMGKATSDNMEDRALCDELKSGSCNRSQKANLTSLIHSHFPGNVASETEHVQAVLGPDDDKQAAAQDLVKLSDSQSQDHRPEAEPSTFTFTSTSDFREPPDDTGIQAQGCNSVTDSDRSGKNATMCKPEASLTPQTKPDDGAFDPGGKPRLPPVPEPKHASPPTNDNRAQPETPHSSELQTPALCSAAQAPAAVLLDTQDRARDALGSSISHSSVLHVRVTEPSSSNNNNNNHTLPETCEMTSVDAKDTSVVHEQPAEEIQTVSPVERNPFPQTAARQPPEFILRRTDERSEDLPDCVHSSEATRISESSLPGIEAQLNICVRQVFC